MSGTLVAQTIQGPSSGANANKVIIPSGHTLDASAGFVPSAGAVIQCVSSDDARGWASTTSTTLVASGISLSITPKFANSVILVDFHLPMLHIPNPSGVSLVAEVHRNGTNLGINGYPQGFIHNAVGDNQYPSLKIECRDATHNSTSALTYEVYYRSTTGGQVHLTHNGSDTHLKLWEIKQ